MRSHMTCEMFAVGALAAALLLDRQMLAVRYRFRIFLDHRCVCKQTALAKTVITSGLRLCILFAAASGSVYCVCAAASGSLYCVCAAASSSAPAGSSGANSKLKVSFHAGAEVRLHTFVVIYIYI